MNDGSENAFQIGEIRVTDAWKWWAAVGLIIGALACLPGSSPEPHVPSDSREASRAPSGSVVLVTIDTLRADRLPLYGYRNVDTPHLDALATEAVVFDNAHSHAPTTLPSHASILTGLHPPEHGIRNNGTYTASDGLKTLAERFSDYGYRTGAFVSAFVLDSRFGLDQGFQVYDDDLEDGRPRWSKFGVKDRMAEGTVDRAIEWINAAENLNTEPFFAWVHLYDPHFEYAAPEPFASRYANPYDAEIAYVDAQLGRLLERLRKLPNYEDLTLVVTADHGESLGEHGESTHSVFVYDATQRIPLIVRFPSAWRAGSRATLTARHVDIVPTLLDTLGIPVDASEISGTSLRSALTTGKTAKPFVYAEAMLPEEQFGWAPLFALQMDGYKFIEAPTPELYDLTTDPSERENLIANEPRRAARMARELAKIREELEPTTSVVGPQPMDEETRAHLSALGYLSLEAADVQTSRSGRDPKEMIGSHEARERAHRAMDTDNYEQAIQELHALLESDPSNPALRLDLAASLAERARWKEAEAVYADLARERPDRVAAIVGLAKIHFKGYQDFDLAEREIDRAQALRPDDPGLWGLRGDLLHEAGRFEEAVGAYERAIEDGDVTPSYLLGYASALHRMGRNGEARSAIERVIRIEHDNPVAHFNHGIILRSLGLPAVAVGALRESIRLNPNLVEARRALARMLAERDHREASRLRSVQGARRSPS